jgi:hypothetical protein
MNSLVHNGMNLTAVISRFDKMVTRNYLFMLATENHKLTRLLCFMHYDYHLTQIQNYRNRRHCYRRPKKRVSYLSVFCKIVTQINIFDVKFDDGPV